MVKQIDYKEGFETIGEFFLQENPDMKYSGILTYSPENGIKLVLMYNFSKSSKFWNHTRNEYYSFCGNVAEYGEITLIGGMQQGGYCDFGTTNKVEFYISYLILGAHLNRTDECIYGANFSFPGFESFCSHITGKQLYVAYAEEWQKRYNKKMGLRAYFEENVQMDDFIYNSFKTYFPDINNVQDISTHLGAIRNCIAHTRNKFDNDKQYKRHKDILEQEVAIQNLCEILFLLFVRTIYKKFGIEQTLFQQGNFEGQLCLWNTIPC